jgi:hypothetical protein
MFVYDKTYSTDIKREFGKYKFVYIECIQGYRCFVTVDTLEFHLKRFDSILDFCTVFKPFFKMTKKIFPLFLLIFFHLSNPQFSYYKNDSNYMLVKSEEQKDTIRLKSDKRLYFYILFLRVKKFFLLP